MGGLVTGSVRGEGRWRLGVLVERKSMRRRINLEGWGFGSSIGGL